MGGQLGASREFLVLVGVGGAKKLPIGPAKLHLQGRRFALTNGVPPRLLGLWELAHLRSAFLYRLRNKLLLKIGIYGLSF